MKRTWMMVAAATAVTTMSFAGAAQADPAPTVGYIAEIGTARVVEGSTGWVELPVTLNEAAPAGGLCFNVLVGADGDSARLNEDYLDFVTSVVRIRAGATSAVVAIPILDDLEPEFDKVLTVSLVAASCAGIGEPSVSVEVAKAGGVVLVDNDDLPLTGTSTDMVWFAIALAGLGAGLVIAARARRTRAL